MGKRNMGKKNTRRRTNKRKKIMKGGRNFDKLDEFLESLKLTVDGLGGRNSMMNRKWDEYKGNQEIRARTVHPSQERPPVELTGDMFGPELGNY